MEHPPRPLAEAHSSKLIERARDPTFDPLVELCGNTLTVPAPANYL